MSKINQTIETPAGAESRLPNQLAKAFTFAVWASIALVLVASLFVSNNPEYIAQAVPALGTPYADSGLALVRDLPLP